MLRPIDAGLSLYFSYIHFFYGNIHYRYCYIHCPLLLYTLRGNAAIYIKITYNNEKICLFLAFLSCLVLSKEKFYFLRDTLRHRRHHFFENLIPLLPWGQIHLLEWRNLVLEALNTRLEEEVFPLRGLLLRLYEQWNKFPMLWYDKLKRRLLLVQ